MNIIPTISKTYTTEGIKRLHLHTFAGDIELIGHEENTIKVEIYASIRSIVSLFIVQQNLQNFDSSVHDFRMGVRGDTLEIFAKPDYFHPYNWVNFLRTSFRIFVPHSIDSQAKTYGGNIVLKKVVGNHQFSTWGGNMLVEGSEGNFQAKTMGGKVEIIGCKGNADLSTMGGKIYVLENEGDIRVDTKGGNISIQKQKGKFNGTTWGGNIEAIEVAGEFECSTLGGNIYLKNMNGNVGVSSKGGNIRAEIPYIHQYAWFDTGGGNITLALPLDSPLEFDIVGSKIRRPNFNNFTGYINDNFLRGKLNGGGPQITAKTSGGKIRLEQATTQPLSSVIQESQEKIAKYQRKKEEITETPPKFSNQPQKQVPFENTPPVKSNLHNIFIASLFCLLLIYGLNGIVYFTLEIINPQSKLSVIYKGVFLSNFVSTIAVVSAFYHFIHSYENRINRNWLKYLVLMGYTAFYVNFLQIFVWAGYWRHLDKSIMNSNQNNFSLFYGILPYIVSAAYFYYWQRTRNISRKISEQEYQLLNLEKLKSKAQLDALEARINPHFLYNSLNSIAGLIHENPDKAEDMTIQLSKLFRYTTGRNNESFHTLAEELDIIKAYLAIEQVRFGKRLSFSIDCDESLFSTKIPRFLLQPLVENAIKHGISKMANEGRIEVKIAEIANEIMIKIHDNGPAFDELLGGGFGLRSIREKLQIVYAEKGKFEIVNEPEKAVIITLPK